MSGQPECEFCYELAKYRVIAQWTIFDWDYVDACAEHRQAARRALDHLVDGEPVLDWRVERLYSEEHPGVIPTET